MMYDKWLRNIKMVKTKFGLNLFGGFVPTAGGDRKWL